MTVADRPPGSTAKGDGERIGLGDGGRAARCPPQCFVLVLRVEGAGERLDESATTVTAEAAR